MCCGGNSALRYAGIPALERCKVPFPNFNFRQIFDNSKRRHKRSEARKTEKPARGRQASIAPLSLTEIEGACDTCSGFSVHLNSIRLSSIKEAGRDNAPSTGNAACETFGSNRTSA